MKFGKVPTGCERFFGRAQKTVTQGAEKGVVFPNLNRVIALENERPVNPGIGVVSQFSLEAKKDHSGRKHPRKS